VDKQDPNLQFKPLSEGLGFHPYSNGLPYSPPKRDTSRGVGAVAAGKPSFAFPQQTVKVTTTAAPIVAKTPQLEIELGWGYLAKRFFAFFVDSFINIVLGSTALVVSLWKEGGTLDFFQPGIFLITVSFLLFFNWALTTAQEVAFGTSIGKKFFGLSLEGTAIATLVRAIFFIPGALFLGTGVLWAVLDSNRRGFHDIISGIQPEES
jgi:hypothetical protein